MAAWELNLGQPLSISVVTRTTCSYAIARLMLVWLLWWLGLQRGNPRAPGPQRLPGEARRGHVSIRDFDAAWQ